MVRLADLPEWDRNSKLEKVKELTGFDAQPWVKPPPLAKCRCGPALVLARHRRWPRVPRAAPTMPRQRRRVAAAAVQFLAGAARSVVEDGEDLTGQFDCAPR